MRVHWTERYPVKFDEHGNCTLWQEQIHEGVVQGYVSAEGRVSAVVQVGVSLVAVDLVELAVARAGK